MTNKQPLLAHEKEGAEKEGAGSVGASAVTLAKICVGCGVMALPWGFMRGGVLSAPGMVLIGVWNWYTSLQLVQCKRALANDPSMLGVGDPQGRPRSAYSALAFAVLGRPGLCLLEGSMLVVLLGVCASMQVQFAQFGAAVCPGLGYGGCVLGSACLLLPLVLQRTLVHLSRVSALGLAVLVLGLCAVAVHGWLEYSGEPISPTLLSAPTLGGAAAFFGIATFSFGVQMMVLPVQEGMAQPSRIGEALALALGAVVGLYLLVGNGLASLYASQGVQQLIVLNLPPGSLLATNVQTCAALVSLLSYPLPLMPVVQLLLASTSPAWLATLLPAHRRESGLRLGILLATSAVALLVPNFGAIAGFLGCLNVAASMVLPPALHLKLVSLPAWHARRHAAHYAAHGAAVARDALLLLLGVATLLFSTALTASALVAHGERPAQAQD